MAIKKKVTEPKVAVVEADEDKGQSVKFTKRTLVDAVATGSGQKKPAVKTVIDVVLAELAGALERGETLILPPLGKLTVTRTKDGKGGEIRVLKLRKLKADVGGSKSDDGEE